MGKSRDNDAVGRPVWSGYLRLSLVAVPVRAYPAGQGEGQGIQFNQLHAQEDCHRRIKYQKICPVHGPLEKDEIILGYEYAPNQYVPFPAGELDALHERSDKSINIDEFIPASSIDTRRAGGRSYFLLPDGQAGAKPYALLARAMREERVGAVGQVTMFGTDHLVLCWPLDRLIVLSQLHYDQELKTPEEFLRALPEETLSTTEIKLTKTLVDASTSKRADFSGYASHYNERLREMVEAKVAGKEVLTTPDEEEAPVISIMDALRKSMARISKDKPARRGKTSRPAKSARRKRAS